MVFIISLLVSLAHANQVDRRAPDFSVVHTSVPHRHTKHDLRTDCRSAIVQQLCLTRAADLDTVDFGNRPCQPGGEKYAPVFQALYDRFPAHLRKMFCFVDKIYIEPTSPSVAYATMAIDPAGQNAAYVGVGQTYLDGAFTLDRIISWKEQINFGGDTTRVNFSPSLPAAHTSLDADFTDALYYVLSHEFAHVFDFANGLNREGGGGPWYELSWGADGNPLPRQDFPLRPSLCFYDCGGNFLRANQQDQLYEQLLPTSFTSAYSTVNSYEDFAETFALYNLSVERQGAMFKFTTASGYNYDLLGKMSSEQMTGKVQYIKDFLAGAFVYPGQN